MMKTSNKIILGGLLGNLAESYDIALCYMLANILTQDLLGGKPHSGTLLLGLLSLAYLAKPLGAMILGLMSDKLGRKQALVFSILMMGLSTVLIAFIPNYYSIGFWAPVFLLSLRVMQSFALGAEFLNSSCYLVESGDETSKGFRGCWTSAGVKAGTLLAAFIVMVLSDYHLSWRYAFIFAGLTTLIGVYIRMRLPESLAYVIYYAERKKPSLPSLIKQAVAYVKTDPSKTSYAFWSSFVAVASGAFYFLYLPFYIKQQAIFPNSFTHHFVTQTLLTVTILIPIFGYLSDKFSRINFLRFGSLGMILLSYPLIHHINTANELGFIICYLLIAVSTAMFYACNTVFLTTLFPLSIRCSILSLIFSIAAGLGAGAVPFIANYIQEYTNYPSLACLVMIAPNLVVFYALMNAQRKLVFCGA